MTVFNPETLDCYSSRRLRLFFAVFLSEDVALYASSKSEDFMRPSLGKQLILDDHMSAFELGRANKSLNSL